VAPTSSIPVALTHGPFTVRQAAGCGVSEAVLRGQRFRRLRRGVYVAAAVPDSFELRLDAARLVLPPNAVFSHETAANILGLPTPRGSNIIHATVESSAQRTRVTGVVVHIAPVVHETVLWRGRPLTAPPRNFVDVAATWELLDLVALGDAVVRRGLSTPADLLARSTIASGRGCRIARSAAGLVVPGVDSPMETRVRLLRVLGGLPMPEINFEIFGADGGWLAKPDLGYSKALVAIEYQGDSHRTDKAQWRYDIEKARLLRELGWVVIELTAADLYQQPASTLAAVHRALVERGYPGVPAQPSDRWRKHWPDIGTASRWQ
jgi:hypothetical protein